MKSRVLAATVAVTALVASSVGAAEGPAVNSRPDVAYTVIFLKDGEPLAKPTVVGKFGQEVSLEVAGMRAVVSASAPGPDSRSFTWASLSVLRDGVWQAPKKMSMEAVLSQTPSFEYTAGGTPYRFVVMPRLVSSVADTRPAD